MLATTLRRGGGAARAAVLFTVSAGAGPPRGPTTPLGATPAPLVVAPQLLFDASKGNKVPIRGFSRGGGGGGSGSGGGGGGMGARGPRSGSGGSSGSRSNFGIFPPSADAWAKGQSPAEAAEWLVDCCRLRACDVIERGGVHSGIFTPAEILCGHSVVWDLLIFSKLAVISGALPKNWSWPLFFDAAAELMPFAFDRDDARSKYGREDVFYGILGIGSGRSLRYTAALIWGFDLASSANDSAEGQRVAADVKAAAPGAGGALKWGVTYAEYKPELFDEVGGAAAWVDLERKVGEAVRMLKKATLHRDVGIITSNPIRVFAGTREEAHKALTEAAAILAAPRMTWAQLFRHLFRRNK